MRSTPLYHAGLFHIVAALLILTCFVPSGILAQEEETDTVLTVRASIVSQTSLRDLIFDVWVRNESDRWHKWANGTFQVQFPNVQMERCAVELLPGTSALPGSEYQIINRTFPGRLSIGVLGPDEYGMCVDVPMNDSIRIGRFRASIPAPDVLPFAIEWVTPVQKYQAAAHKINVDSLPWNLSADNIDMNSRGLATRYLVDAPDEPGFILTYFEGEYYGDKQVRLRWGTEKEYLNRGFLLVRGVRPFGDLDNSNVEFIDTVACHTEYAGADPDCKSPNLNSPGISFVPRDYVYDDTIDFRDEQYVYELLYQRDDLTLIQLDTVTVDIPGSVISFAQANPNPFTEKTLIEYRIEDRVILTAKVFDVNGREVKTLINSVDTPIGRYEVEFIAPEIAQQGVYVVRFMAIPVDDPHVEISTADLKIQLVR